MTGLPADVMYSLDECVQLGAMTADVHAYITLLDEDPLGWHDSLGGSDEFIRLLNATARQRMAAWRESADLDDRATITWIGFQELPSTLTDSARHVLSEAIKLRGPDRNAVDLLLKNRDFVADNAAPFIPAFNEVVMRARDDVRIMGRAAFCESQYLVPDLYRRVNERRMQLISQSIQAEQAAQFRRPVPKSVRKAKRKPLVKAIGLLSKIGGQQTAAAFVSGDDVVVTGKRFNFRARKGVLSSNGHGAINLTVTDKDNIELVDLCFYFENMPAPDQLAALILHVKAGNEDDIITTGNAIRTYAAGKTYAPILELREARKRRNETRYGTAANASALPGQANPFAAMMAKHIDKVLYDGRSGSSEAYNRFHDTLVPVIAKDIMEVARTSKAGAFLSSWLPEAAALLSTPKPSRADAISFDEVEEAEPMPLIANLRLPSIRTVTI
ncbi:hypothetical protein HFO56_23545 [Rhizobium laguerreae]|uniref:hypothetical protein n=1 Tax=Rhizobium laguerreae TaxID=1076926 RepID=UPI001C8FAFC4|nr:hypothetical protein [Rhizobium laguerreae]MBY3155301.1 hypothetical protein [Rhizobium laguerreae]